MTFIDYLYILMRHRRLLIINFLVVAILTAIYSLIMPKTFSSTAIVLPPEGSSNLLSNLSSNLPISGGLLGSLGGISDETYILIAILKSRSISESAINRFNLMERYNAENMEEAVKIFRDKTEISVDDEGMINVTATSTTNYFASEKDENESQKLCADIANFLVSELNRLNTELRTKQARFNRLFIEKRYEENKEDLRKAEQEMKRFSEKSGVISLPDQISAAINAAAQLKSQIAIKEIQLEAMKSTLDSNHPEIRKYEIELRELRKKVNELKFGSSIKDSIAIFPAFTSAPELGMRYLQLKRDLEVQNQIFEFLTQQYEQAKIQEAKDTPTVQPLDSAVIPVKRSKPKRAVLTLLAGILSIFMTAIYVYIIEYLDQLKREDEAKYKKLNYVIRGFNIFKKNLADNPDDR